MMLFMLSVMAIIPGFGDTPKAGMITDSINGVAIWSSFEDVERAFRAQLGGKEDEDEEEEAEDRGSRKLAWTLPTGDYSAMAMKINDKKQIRWVTGFLRPGSEKPFEAFGDLSKASHNASAAIWSVRSPKGPYRLVAKGGNGKASVVYLIRLN